MPNFITDERLKEELTTEQYERYLQTKEAFGEDAAICQLPPLTDTIVERSGAVNGILKKIRLHHGLTQSDVANVINVSQREYWRYEQEGYSVNFYNLAMLAMFYNVSLDCFTGYFFDENGIILKPMFPVKENSVNGYILSEMKEAKAKGEKYKPHNWVLEHLQKEGNSEEE